MSEAFGRGFYPGPVWKHQTHKTDYGNAVWQCLKPTARHESTAVEIKTAPTDAKPESERQGQRAAGVDGKLLTELLGAALESTGYHCSSTTTVPDASR